MREIETLITKKHLSNRNEEHVADVGYTFKKRDRNVDNKEALIQQK